MGRDPRPLAPGAIYHVTSRGNRKQPIFSDDVDRETLLRGLNRVTARYRWSLLAYCFMGNHIHLVLETPEPNLSLGMRDLLGRYAWHHNRRHGVQDHLFGRRYWSGLIADDAQLISTIVYVARNPLRGGLVERAEDWPWSSYPSLIGLATPARCFDPREVLSYFGRYRSVARGALRYLVDEGVLRRDRWGVDEFLAA